MSDSMFEIGAEGVDVEKVMAAIRESVIQKSREGHYSDALVARAERMNLAQLRNDDEFLGFYLKCLRDAVFVDISDFEIRERRKRFAKFWIKVKTTIWNLLKFYTYRLWSQQNEVNGLLVTAVEGLDNKLVDKIKTLEKRVAELEDQQNS